LAFIFALQSIFLIRVYIRGRVKNGFFGISLHALILMGAWCEAVSW